MDPISVRDMMPRLAVGVVLAVVAAVVLQFFDASASDRPSKTAAATASDEQLTARM